MSSSADRLDGAGGAHRTRAAALGIVAALVVLALAALAAATLRSWIVDLRNRPSVQLDDAIVLVALIIMVAALLWLALLLVVCSAQLLRRPRHRTEPERPLTWQLAPELALRVTGVLLALTAFGSTTAQAAQAPDPGIAVSVAERPAPVPGFGLPSTPAPAPACEEAAPVPGWTPQRPSAVRARGADHVNLVSGCRGSTADAGAEIVVRRGDDLWSIVERHLGDQADPARIAQDWPRWYAANRQVIGDDPNLLLVGQVLHAPQQADDEAGARR